MKELLFKDIFGNCGTLVRLIVAGLFAVIINVLLFLLLKPFFPGFSLTGIIVLTGIILGWSFVLWVCRAGWDKDLQKMERKEEKARQEAYLKWKEAIEKTRRIRSEKLIKREAEISQLLDKI